MTQNFPKLTTMTEVRKNSTETTTIFSKMSKVGVSAKADTPKRRFRSQKICDAEIEVSAEAEVKPFDFEQIMALLWAAALEEHVIGDDQSPMFT